MHAEGFFFQAFVYLAAAVVSVPVAKRLGLGSVLGYLIAGIIIGPFGLGLVGEEGQDVMHFAEFGVVMMLFLVGLELQPSLLWRLRVPILGLGGLQVVATTALVAGIAALLGLSGPEAVAVGMILAMSSTAIALQTLGEKGLLKGSAGQSAFSVLLFQDIAVIPILALMPFLATRPAASDGSAHGTSWVEGVPAYQHALIVLGAVTAIVAGGHFLMRPAFRAVARTGIRELFTAAGLLLVIGIALLMTKVGLSPALGTFVAGVVLAGSEYRHELESDIEPFKGLLLGLFFIAVGASIDFRIVTGDPGTIALLVAGVMALKLTVLAVSARSFKLSLDQNLIFSFVLCQAGEFAFVLLSFAAQNGVLTPEITGYVSATVALTMTLTPVVILLNERLLLPRAGTREKPAREADRIDEELSVIIAGYGRFGQIAGRLLGASGIRSTILEYDSDQVEMLRRMGQKVFYGDATRHDLLHSAGAARAKLLIIAIDEQEKRLELVHSAKKHFPNLTILARASNRTDAYELLDAGVEHVYRETFDTSLRAGMDALRLLGFRAHRAHRLARAFHRHDEHNMREMANMRHNEKDWLRVVRQRVKELERVMQADVADRDLSVDAAWDVESLRDDVRKGTFPLPR